MIVQPGFYTVMPRLIEQYGHPNSTADSHHQIWGGSVVIFAGRQSDGEELAVRHSFYCFKKNPH